MDVISLVVGVVGAVVGIAGCGLGLFSLLVTIAGVFGYQQIKKWMGEVAANRADALLQEQLPGLVEDFTSRAENEFIRYANIFALFAVGKHAEVLDSADWKEGQTVLPQDRPDAVNRCVVESIYRVDRNLQSATMATEASWKLYSRNPNSQNLALFMSMCVKAKQWGRALAVWQTAVDEGRDGSENAQCAVLASVCYRRTGDSRRALELATKYRRPGDQDSELALASLLRDDGDSEKALVLLKPFVDRYRDESQQNLPRGWHRVMNTYIAACMDVGDREAWNAFTAGTLVMDRPQPGPVELATVLRLLWWLGGQQTEIDTESLYERCVDEVEKIQGNDEAILQCRVWVKLAKREASSAAEAADLANTGLRRSLARSGGRQSPEERAYYLRCLHALCLWEDGNAAAAIEGYQKASETGLTGEAYYGLAIAHAKLGAHEECLRVLQLAVERRRRWLSVAKIDNRLANVKGISELVKDHARI